MQMVFQAPCNNYEVIQNPARSQANTIEESVGFWLEVNKDKDTGFFIQVHKLIGFCPQSPWGSVDPRRDPGMKEEDRQK